MELEARVRDAVDRAREDARRRGHAELLESHLLLQLAVPDSSDLAVVFTAHGVCRALLRDRLETLLAAEPTRGGYRDPSDGRAVSLAPDLAAAVASRDAPDLVRFLLGHPALIQARVDSGWDLAPVDRFFAAATVVARRHRRQDPSTEDILVAGCDEPLVAAALRELGHEPDALKPRLEAAMPPPSVADLFVQEFRRAWRELRPRSAGWPAGAAVALANLQNRRELSGATVVIEALRTPDAKALLSAVSVNCFDLFFRLVHAPRPLPAAEIPESGKVEVVFWNDDFSTQEYVAHLLVAVFGHRPDEAVALMTKVHEAGSAIVATLEAAEARRLVARARAENREALMPLRIEVRASQTSSAGV